MNELKINVTEQKFEITDLKTCTQTINNLKALGNVSTLAIAKALFIIEDNNFLMNETGKDGNSKTDIYEYAKENFDYSRPTVSNMLRVARKFLIDERFDLWTKYSYGALLELCMIEYDEVLGLVTSGKINPTMTTKQIRELVKKLYKEDEAEEAKAEEVDETEETKETEVDTKSEIKATTLKNLRLLISNFDLDNKEKTLVKAIEKGIAML